MCVYCMYFRLKWRPEFCVEPFTRCSTEALWLFSCIISLAPHIQSEHRKLLAAMSVFAWKPSCLDVGLTPSLDAVRMFVILHAGVLWRLNWTPFGFQFQDVVLTDSSCVFSAQMALSEEKGQCHRVLGSGLGPSSCSLPILRNITKQICCCSRVGKAWGANCQRCPYFGSGLCPRPQLLAGC